MSRVHIFDGYKGAFVNFRAQLIEDLIARGHEVTVSAPDIDASMTSLLHGKGVRSRSIRLDRVGINPGRDFLGFLSIIRAIRASKADVVMAFSSKAIIYSTIAAFLLGVSTRAAFVTGLGYTFVNTSGRGQMARFFQHRLYRVALRLATIVFFQNRDDVAAFEDLGLLGSSKRVEITNGSGVDIKHFQARPLQARNVFLMVGRLLRGKGVVEYCRAARLVRRDVPHAKFLFAGWADADNPDALDPAEVGALMRECGVDYLGKLADVRPALEECCVFVLPSYREGTPRSALEALAMGRAIITSDAPGCRETVAEGWNGFLVPVRDAEALAAAMRRYTDDPDLAALHGRRSREYAERKFDVHAVNAAILGAIGLAASSA